MGSNLLNQPRLVGELRPPERILTQAPLLTAMVLVQYISGPATRVTIR